MMILVKKVANGMSILKRAYYNRIIPYPRVDVNFIKDTPLQFYPHPPILPFSKESEPFKESIVPLRKESLFMLFNILKLITPASVENWSSFIEKNFNDEGIPFDGLRKKGEFLEELQKEEDIDYKEIVYGSLSIYQKREFDIFSIKGVVFKNANRTKEQESKDTVSVIAKENENMQKSVYEFDSLSDALLFYRKKRKHSKILKEKFRRLMELEEEYNDTQLLSEEGFSSEERKRIINEIRKGV